MTARQILAGEHLTGGLREGRVGAVARTPEGKLVAVTAKRVFQNLVSGSRNELSSNDLLTTIPLSEGLGGSYQPRLTLRPSAALGHAVFREVNDATRAPGRISALYGTVLVQDSNAPLRVHGLLEVSFAEISERSNVRMKMPPIAENELGKLVMTYEGAGVGLIVGGVGYLAVVAPLHPFVQEHGLALLPSDFKTTDVTVGLDLLYNDLNRVQLLDLGEIPEAA